MTEKEQVDKTEFLKSRGWFQWYNENYWCHKQFGNAERDCTNWGLSLDHAYDFESQPEIRSQMLLFTDLLFTIRKAVFNLISEVKKK